MEKLHVSAPLDFFMDILIAICPYIFKISILGDVK